MENNKKEDQGEDDSECWLVWKLLDSVLPVQA